MSALSEKIEELLEKLWVSIREKHQKGVSFASLELDKQSEDIRDMKSMNFITVDDENVYLTEEGVSKGENIVRRHRLAEKLLADVIEVSGSAIHETACELEHHLKEGIEDKVCTLMGHPRTCPDGNAIPEGPCCKADLKVGDKYVSALSRLKFGQKGKIAYIQGIEHKNLQNLASMGILPGAVVVVKQTFPSFLFVIGNTEFAVDKDIADAIFVRVELD